MTAEHDPSPTWMHARAVAALNDLYDAYAVWPGVPALPRVLVAACLVGASRPFLYRDSTSGGRLVRFDVTRRRFVCDMEEASDDV